MRQVGETLWFRGQSFERHWLETSGGALSILRCGAGRTPLVLCHGLTDNAWCWRALAVELAEQFDVIMLDARGHGASARVTFGNSVDLGADLSSVFDALGIARAILVGHSVGARGALDFAGSRPERIEKLVMEDPPLLTSTDADAFRARSEKFRNEVEALQALDDEAILERGRAAGPNWAEHEFEPWLQAKRQTDPRAMPQFTAPWVASVRQVQSPILLLHGLAERGSLISDDLVAAMIANAPHAKVDCIDRSGHNIRRDNPGAYSAALLAFLGL